MRRLWRVSAPPVPGLRALVVLVSAIVLCDTIFYAAVTPLLPTYADDLGIGKTGAGLLEAAYAAGTLVREHPALRVHVSSIGAPYLVQPEALERSARRVFGAAFAPDPEEPVLASTITRPCKRFRAMSGARPSKVAVAKQPGLLMRAAFLIASRFVSVKP